MLKGKKVIVVVLLLALLVAALMIFTHLGSKTDRGYARATSNIQNSWLHDNNLYFFTGTFFAKYNLEKNTVDRLSDYLFIKSGIASVSWSTGSVVFQTSPTGSDRDDVTTAASRFGLNPSLSHWWRYDFQTRQYQLLNFSNISSCSSVAEISFEFLACLASSSKGSSSSEVRLFDVANKSSIKLQDSEDTLSDLSSDGKTIFYIRTGLSGKQALESVDVSSRKNRELYSSSGVISYFVGDNNTVVIDEIPKLDNSANTEEGHEHDKPAVKTSQNIILIQDGQLLKKDGMSSLPVTFFKDGDGVLLSSLDGSISRVDEQGVHNLDKATRKELDQSDFLFKYKDRFFVLKQDNTLLVWPKTPFPKNYRNPSSFKYTNNDVSGSSYIDTEVNGVRDAAIYLDNINSSQQQLAVADNLEKQGFRPSEFNFNWILDGADFHVPIDPSVVIID